MTETTVGREPVQIVEIKQPLCANDYGVSPCTASGTNDEKCYLTRATCQDTANFALGAPLSLYFGKGRIAEQSATTRLAAELVEIASIPAQDDATWTLRSFDASAYIGRQVRLVIRYQSGSSFTGDAQFDDFTIGSVTYDPENGTEGFERNSDAGSTVSDYASVSWQALTSGYAQGKMFRDDLGTMSSGTGNTSGNTGDYYFYAETSNPGFPDKYFWLRSPIVTLDSATVSFYSAQNGATCGPITAYLEVLELDPLIIPSLVSVSTSPTRINLAGANPDAQGLGNRALCTLVFQDHAHTDRIVDPYVSGRSWDPLSADRGSFWTRWLVRNKYRQNIVIIVYEGYEGQSLTEMTSRQYFLQEVIGPDSSGRVTIRGKDILARLEERKAQAPVASPGELYAGINSSVTSFEVAGAVEADYAASGTIRIGDEIMTYTSRATSTNGITFSGVTRGTDNTTADDHSAEDAVQQCLRYSNETIDDTLDDLLTTYGGIDAAYLDTSGWATEVDTYLSLYRANALITEPTSVSKLVSRLQEQALFYVWWDERARLVKLKAIRGIDEEPDTLTDAANIISGSVSFTEKPRERASQVWVYYGQDDFTASPDEADSYANAYVLANLESETAELYGEPSIRKIFAQFLTSGQLAANTASKIITRYVDVPAEVKFRMDAKDRDYWIGDTFFLSHYLDVDQYGARRLRQWTIVSAEEVVPGEVVEYVCEDTTLYGKVHYIMASGAADYPGYDSAPFKNCYIGNSSGLLSDGEEAGRIS